MIALCVSMCSYRFKSVSNGVTVGSVNLVTNVTLPNTNPSAERIRHIMHYVLIKDSKSAEAYWNIHGVWGKFHKIKRNCQRYFKRFSLINVPQTC